MGKSSLEQILLLPGSYCCASLGNDDVDNKSDKTDRLTNKRGEALSLKSLGSILLYGKVRIVNESGGEAFLPFSRRNEDE